MPAPRLDLLDLAIEAHDEAELWRGLDALHVRLRFRGPTLATRGRSPRVKAMTATLLTHRPSARLAPYPHAGHVGVLDEGEVWIEDTSGRVLRRRRIAPGTRGPWRWDDLDELYFLAYAFWNYGTTPFLLARPDVAVRELPPAGPLRRLRATFPPSLPTHCPEQTFCFVPGGLLRRLDCTADVFRPMARAAHVVGRHETFDGLVMPTHRRVVPRVLHRWPRRAPAVMEGWIDDVTLERG